MKRELVAIKGDGTHWDVVYDVSHSEGKYITDFNQVIEIIKTEYPWLKDCEFEHADMEIFVYTDSTTCVNPGTACKI